jgi:hypothetical protein
MGHSTSSDKAMGIASAMAKCEVSPEILSSVSLPLPEKDEQFTSEMDERFSKLQASALSGTVFSLRDTSLAFPQSLFSLQIMTHSPVIVATFPASTDTWRTAHWLTATWTSRTMMATPSFTWLQSGATFYDIQTAVRAGSSIVLANKDRQTPV